MGSENKWNTAGDTQTSLPGWMRKLIERVFSVQGSSGHGFGQTAQIVQYVKVMVSLAASSCNTTGLLVLLIKEI